MTGWPFLVMTVEGVTRDCREMGCARMVEGRTLIRNPRERSRARNFMAGHDAIDGVKVQIGSGDLVI